MRITRKRWRYGEEEWKEEGKVNQKIKRNRVYLRADLKQWLWKAYEESHMPIENNIQ